MHPTIEALLAARPVLTDGAWGTQLQAEGLQPHECPDSWNLTHPDRVLRVARAYVEAGSQVILTNTFGANAVRLAGYGLADQGAAINRAGVAISREAAANRARVFASLGPTGKMLLDGAITVAELDRVFGEQAAALAEAGADALVVETFSDLEEAGRAIAAARRTGLPVVASLVFDSGRDKDRTMMGVTPERAAKALEEMGADVMGANCGQGIAGYVSVCRRMRSATAAPLWIKANAGLPELEAGRAVYGIEAEEFAGYGPALVEAGADFIGGCCGTTPEFIRALRMRIQKP